MAQTSEVHDDGIRGNPAVVMLSRMGERVAALEANHGSLKGDTENIRSSVHQINSEMQKIVIVQERISSALGGVTTELSKIVAAAPAIERAVQAFEGMRTDLRLLIEDRHRRDGERSRTQVMMFFMRGLIPWIVALGAMSTWAWEHLSFHG